MGHVPVEIGCSVSKCGSSLDRTCRRCMERQPLERGPSRSGVARRRALDQAPPGPHLGELELQPSPPPHHRQFPVRQHVHRLQKSKSCLDSTTVAGLLVWPALCLNTRLGGRGLLPSKQSPRYSSAGASPCGRWDRNFVLTRTLKARGARAWGSWRRKRWLVARFGGRLPTGGGNLGRWAGGGGCCQSVCLVTSPTGYGLRHGT